MRLVRHILVSTFTTLKPSNDRYLPHMKTFPVQSADSNSKVGFEIENAYASPREVARILSEIAGVSDIQRVGSWFSGSDIRLRFHYQKDSYVVVEPFGDNSRYFIGPESQQLTSDQIEQVETAFRSYKPSIPRQVVGDILTLKPLTYLIRLVRRKSDGFIHSKRSK